MLTFYTLYRKHSFIDKMWHDGVCTFGMSLWKLWCKLRLSCAITGKMLFILGLLRKTFMCWPENWSGRFTQTSSTTEKLRSKAFKQQFPQIKTKNIYFSHLKFSRFLSKILSPKHTISVYEIVLSPKSNCILYRPRAIFVSAIEGLLVRKRLVVWAGCLPNLPEPWVPKPVPSLNRLSSPNQPKLQVSF